MNFSYELMVLQKNLLIPWHINHFERKKKPEEKRSNDNDDAFLQIKK